MSGMTLYYTNSLRKYDASVFVVGQEYLHIPPQATSSFNHTCPSTCTSEMFQERVYVTRAVNHMHYLGNIASYVGNVLLHVQCTVDIHTKRVYTLYNMY